MYCLLMTLFSMDSSQLLKRLHVSVLISWLSSNKMVAHETKTKLMWFTLKVVDYLPKIRFSCVKFEWVDKINHLGVMLDHMLSLVKQIDFVSLKLNKARNIIHVVSSI